MKTMVVSTLQYILAHQDQANAFIGPDFEIKIPYWGLGALFEIPNLGTARLTQTGQGECQLICIRTHNRHVDGRVRVADLSRVTYSEVCKMVPSGYKCIPHDLRPDWIPVADAICRLVGIHNHHTVNDKFVVVNNAERCRIGQRFKISLRGPFHNDTEVVLVQMHPDTAMLISLGSWNRFSDSMFHIDHSRTVSMESIKAAVPRYTITLL